MKLLNDEANFLRYMDAKNILLLYYYFLDIGKNHWKVYKTREKLNLDSDPSVEILTLNNIYHYEASTQSNASRQTDRQNVPQCYFN